MRTTVTLEPEIATKLKDLSRRKRASFKSTLNRCCGVVAAQQRAPRQPRFVVKPHASGSGQALTPESQSVTRPINVDDFARASRDDSIMQTAQ